MFIFGWLGIILFQVFYIPQTIQMIKTKEVEDISLPAWLILLAGIVASTIYAISIRDPIFSTGSILAVGQTSLQIGLILRYRRPRPSL